MKACAPEVVRVLEAAATAASSARHAEVTREHVLAALLEVDDLWHRVLPLRACVDELRHLVSLRLSEMPAIALYRDAPVFVPLAPAVSEDVDRAEKTLFRSEVGIERLLGVVTAAPEIAELVTRARLDLGGLDDLLERAQSLASERRHDAVYAEHVFRVLVDQRWFSHALQRARGDIDRLRDRLEELLALAPPMATHGAIHPTLELEELVDRVEVGTSHAPTGADFVVFAAEVPEIGRLVESGGTTIGRLADATRQAAASREGRGPTEVILYKDARTPSEFVVSVLKEVFALSEESAERLVASSSEGGAVVVGSYSEPVARNRVETVLGRARRLEFPLRIELRPRDPRR